jgi:7-carboxy-7-deazaguanine synthase
MINISEVFQAIQAEGVLAGVPSVFIRLSAPIERCTWCEMPNVTPWSLEGVDVYMGALLSNIRKQYVGHAVVLGGEPMLHPDLASLCEALSGIDQHVTVECPGSAFQRIKCDLMSITPKLKTAAPARKAKGPKVESAGYDIDALRQLIQSNNYQLKFVVRDRAEMEEVKQIVDEVQAERSRVLLIPEATKPKDLREQSEWIVEACKFFNFRYGQGLQTQIAAPRKPEPLVPPAPRGWR